MTQSEKNQVNEFFTTVLKYKKKEQYLEYPVSALVFSYLMGMDPAECRNMYVESEWSKEEINEYDDIEAYVHQIIRELD